MLRFTDTESYILTVLSLLNIPKQQLFQNLSTASEQCSTDCRTTGQKQTRQTSKCHERPLAFTVCASSHKVHYKNEMTSNNSIDKKFWEEVCAKTGDYNTKDTIQSKHTHTHTQIFKKLIFSKNSLKCTTSGVMKTHE